MRHIRVDEISALRQRAEEVYRLGQEAPGPEFDTAVDKLIECLDEVCESLEKQGRQAAEQREIVAVEGLHEALNMTHAAMGAIDVVRRCSGWNYRGTVRSARQHNQDGANVVGLPTLKLRYNDLMAQMRHEKVRSIVRETLEEHFRDEFEFEPILVVPAADEFGGGDGSAFLRIAVVFDGDQDRLDPTWTSGFITRIRPRLAAEGIEEFPSVSFIEKSEWWQSYPRWERRHPEAIQLVEFPHQPLPLPEGPG